MKLYLLLTAHDEVIASNGLKIPMPEGSKMLYAYESQEKAHELGKKLGVGVYELTTYPIKEDFDSKTIN
jgi:hypothetical protein